MSKEVVKAIFDENIAGVREDLTFDAYFDSIKGNEEYKKGLFENYVNDGTKSYEEFNAETFGVGKPEAPSEVGGAESSPTGLGLNESEVGPPAGGTPPGAEPVGAPVSDAIEPIEPVEPEAPAVTVGLEEFSVIDNKKDKGFLETIFGWLGGEKTFERVEKPFEELVPAQQRLFQKGASKKLSEQIGGVFAEAEKSNEPEKIVGLASKGYLSTNTFANYLAGDFARDKAAAEEINVFLEKGVEGQSEAFKRFKGNIDPIIAEQSNEIKETMLKDRAYINLNKEIDREFANQRAEIDAKYIGVIDAEKQAKLKEDTVGLLAEYDAVMLSLPTENDVLAKENEMITKYQLLVNDGKMDVDAAKAELQKEYNSYIEDIKAKATEAKNTYNSGLEKAAEKIKSGLKDTEEYKQYISELTELRNGIITSREGDLKAIQARIQGDLAPKYNERINSVIRASSSGPTPLLEKSGLLPTIQKVINNKGFDLLPFDQKKAFLDRAFGNVVVQLREKGVAINDGTVAQARNEFDDAVMSKAYFTQKGTPSLYMLKTRAIEEAEKLDEVIASEKKSISTQKGPDAGTGYGEFTPQSSVGSFTSKSLRQLQLAREKLQEIIDLPESMTDNEFKNFWNGLSSGQFIDYLPFVSGLKNLAGSLALYRSLEDDTPASRYLQNAVALGNSYKGVYEANNMASDWYKSGTSTVESIPFMGEFVFTAGMSSVARKSTEKFLIKLFGGATEKTVAGKGMRVLAGTLVGALAQTTTNPQRYIDETIKRMTPQMSMIFSEEGDDLIAMLDESTAEGGFEAFLKGYGVTASEYFSENLGFAGARALRYAGSKMMQNEFLKRLVVGYYMSKLNIDMPTAVKRLAGAAGYNGLPMELVEEIFNKPLTNLITGDADVMAGILTESGDLDIENLMEVVRALVPISAVGVGANVGGVAVKSMTPENVTISYRDINNLPATETIDRGVWDKVTEALKSPDKLREFISNELPRLKVEGKAREIITRELESGLSRFEGGVVESTKPPQAKGAAETQPAPKVSVQMVERKRLSADKKRLVGTGKFDFVVTIDGKEQNISRAEYNEYKRSGKLPEGIGADVLGEVDRVEGVVVESTKDAESIKTSLEGVEVPAELGTIENVAEVYEQAKGKEELTDEEVAVVDFVEGNVAKVEGASEGISEATPVEQAFGGAFTTTEQVSSVTPSGISVSNKAQVAQLESKTTDTKKRAIIKAATTAINTLKSIFPEMDIVLHDNEGSYDAQMGTVKGRAGSAGNFAVMRNAGGKVVGGRIDINLNKANMRTVAHEVAHAVMLKSFGDSPALFKAFRNNISKILSDSTVEGLNNFASQYSEFESHEEFLVELAAVLTENEQQLPTSTVQKIAELINKVVSKITNGKLQPFSGTVQAKELIDFLNTMSSAIGKGEAIETTNIQALSQNLSAPIGSPVVINKSQVGKPINFSSSAPELSFVTEKDKIDINKLLSEIIKKKQKVWFWMADQLGRGYYNDEVINGEHYLDAGPSFALDPANRSKGILWASGLAEKTLDSKIKESDYVFFISGSPEKAKLFNKSVLNLIAKRIESKSNFKAFKNAINSFPKETVQLKTIKNALEKVDSFEQLANSTMRKDFLIAIDEISKLKTAKGGSLKQLLESFNAFIDLNELRDGFYRDNGFEQNDIMLIGKPTGVGGKAPHTTYERAILGEVVGVPDKKIDAWEIMPQYLKEKYKDVIKDKESKTKPLQTKVIAAEVGVVRELQPISKSQAAEVAEGQKKPSRVATFFSGAGTMEASLPNAQSVMAVEFNPAYVEAYNKAFGVEYKPKDVRDINPDEVIASKPDIFHASPVCKNFSAAKNKRTVLKSDMESADAVARVIREAQPPIVTIENVPDYQGTVPFETIIKALEDAGYTFDVGVYNSADFGGVQNRKRLLIRAVKSGELPPIQEKTAPGDWYSAIEDLIESAPDSKFESRSESENWEMARIKDMIRKGKLDPSKPIITMGGSASRGLAAAANAGGPAPTLLSTFGSVPRIILPDGTVKRVTPEMMRRLMGLPESYPIPSNPRIAKEVLGNGVDGAFTRALIDPLLNRAETQPSAETPAKPLTLKEKAKEAKQKADEAAEEIKRLLKGRNGGLGISPFGRAKRLAEMDAQTLIEIKNYIYYKTLQGVYTFQDFVKDMKENFRVEIRVVDSDKAIFDSAASRFEIDDAFAKDILDLKDNFLFSIAAMSGRINMNFLEFISSNQAVVDQFVQNAQTNYGLNENQAMMLVKDMYQDALQAAANRSQLYTTIDQVKDFNKNKEELLAQELEMQKARINEEIKRRRNFLSRNYENFKNAFISPVKNFNRVFGYKGGGLMDYRTSQEREVYSARKFRMGASTKAANWYNEVYKMIYGDLNYSETERLNKYLIYRRIVDVAEMRNQRAIEHENLKKELASGVTPVRKQQIKDEMAALEKSGIDEVKSGSIMVNGKREQYTTELARAFVNDIDGRTDAEATKIKERAEMYTKANNELLKMRLDAGLISQEAYDSMEKRDYVRRMFIDLSNTSIDEVSYPSVSKEIKAIKQGSEDKILEMDTQTLLQINSQITFDAVAKNNFMNKVVDWAQNKQQRYLDEAIKKAENVRKKRARYLGSTAQDLTPDEIDKLTKEQTLFIVLGNNDKAPSGFTSMKYFVNGIEKNIAVRNDMVNLFQTPSGRGVNENSLGVKILSNLLLTPLIKSSAVFLNPAFAIGNFALDVIHASMVTMDLYKSFSKNIATILIRATGYTAENIYRKSVKYGASFFGQTARDSKFENLVKDYFEHGGGMSGLSNPTSRMYSDKLSKTALSQAFGDAKDGIVAVLDVINSLQSGSELITRVIIYEAALEKNIAAYKDKHGVDPTGYELTLMKISAAASAADLIDFREGTSATRVLDQTMLPFLNAMIQGAKAEVDFASKNPLLAATRLAEFGGMALAVALYNVKSGEDDEKEGIIGYSGVSEYIKSNYFVMMMPWTKVNERGEVVRPFLSIKLPAALKATNILVSGMVSDQGSSNTIGQVVGALEGGYVPEIGSIPPLGQITMALTANKDAFRKGAPIYRGRPDVLLTERFNAGETKAIYRDLFGAAYDLMNEDGENKGVLGFNEAGPAQWQAAFEKAISPNNPYYLGVTSIYAGFSSLYGKENQKEVDVLMDEKFSALNAFRSRVYREPQSGIQAKNIEDREKIDFLRDQIGSWKKKNDDAIEFAAKQLRDISKLDAGEKQNKIDRFFDADVFDFISDAQIAKSVRAQGIKEIPENMDKIKDFIRDEESRLSLKLLEEFKPNFVFKHPSLKRYALSKDSYLELNEDLISGIGKEYDLSRDRKAYLIALKFVAGDDYKDIVAQIGAHQRDLSIVEGIQNDKSAIKYKRSYFRPYDRSSKMVSSESAINNLILLKYLLENE